MTCLMKFWRRCYIKIEPKLKYVVGELKKQRAKCFKKIIICFNAMLKIATLKVH